MIVFEGKIEIDSQYVSIKVILDGNQIGYQRLDGVTLEEWDRLRDLANNAPGNTLFEVRSWGTTA